MSIMMLVSTVGLRFYLGYLNKKKAENQYTEKSNEQRLKSIEELGDYHPGTLNYISGYFHHMLHKLTSCTITDFFYTL